MPKVVLGWNKTNVFMKITTNCLRSVAVALGLSAFSLVSVEVCAQQAGMTAAQFLANPAGFTQGKTAAQLQAAAAALLQGATDAEKQQIATALIALVPTLPAASQNAIGMAIGQVASLLRGSNPTLAASLQQSVASSNIPALVTGFAMVVGQGGAFGGGPGGGGPGGGGLGGGGLGGLGALGGATTQTIIQNNKSASP